jgi:hypothetical protein
MMPDSGLPLTLRRFSDAEKQTVGDMREARVPVTFLVAHGSEHLMCATLWVTRRPEWSRL